MKALREYAVAALAMAIFAVSPTGRAQDAGAGAKLNQNPDAAKFVTSDLGNFLHAYALASHATTDEEKAAIYQREYLDKGSPGLKDFIDARIKSAANLVRAIDMHPKYYAGLQDVTPQIAPMEPAMRASFRKLKELYGDAVFPDVYFLVGRMNSGGTTGASGLLIGLEMHAKTATTDMGEMDNWLKAVLGPPDQLPGIVAHELIHYQQTTNNPKTLIAASIIEGSADFVGKMISGQSINQNIYAYGNAHEGELWQEFRGEMNGTDFSHWLYQGDKSKDRPADLGYFMGYRICEAYYDRATDKRQALRDILTVSDFSALLRDSHYADKFAQASASRNLKK
ncbi:MAG TPA: DUF2268 domain-containing putative Zn-dependent protease [Candidatus Acidoferrales bacterium]|nr:DUF2268 domain-containing putative Zn-dependent protease [Candidatus Acidoferrales bacterium]